MFLHKHVGISTAEQMQSLYGNVMITAPVFDIMA